MLMNQAKGRLDQHKSVKQRTQKQERKVLTCSVERSTELTVFRQNNQKKKKKESTQITKSRNERGDVAMNFTEIKRIIRKCQEQVYANRLNILDEMVKFLKEQKY